MASQQNTTILAILLEMDHTLQAHPIQTEETLKSSEGYHPAACFSEALHKLRNILNLNHFVPLLIGKTKRISGSAWLELVLMENSCGKNPRGNLTSKTGLQMNQAVTKNAQTWKLMLHNFLGLAGNVKILQGILFVRNDTHSFWIKKQMNQE